MAANNMPTRNGWFAVDIDGTDPFVEFGRFIGENFVTITGHGSDWSLLIWTGKQVIALGDYGSLTGVERALKREHLLGTLG